MAGVVAVVGVGAGVGSAVAARFARAGYTVALLGRNADKLRGIEDEIRAAGGAATSFVADAASPQSLRDAFAAIQKSLGDVDVLVYNAGPAFARKSILELDASLLEEGFKAGCTGALVAAQQVLPGMIAKKKGTILLTGATASLRGGENFVALAAPKAALRMLGQSLAREFGPKGVHVAHIVLDGVVNLPSSRAYLKDRAEDGFLAPSAIAEQYFQLHQQHITTWTQELDLRPYSEKF